MVAVRAITTALAIASVSQGVLANRNTINFADNYLKPGQVQPLTYSNGWQFQNIDLVGGVLDAAGNIVEALLATLGLTGHDGLLGGLLAYLRPPSRHYQKPGRIYHSAGKPFNILSLKALCCAADLSKKCNVLDCHIKLTGFDKAVGGKKIYDHDFYVPKSYNHGKQLAPIDIDVNVDGILNLGVIGEILHALQIEINLLNIIDIDVNTGKKPRGRYAYKPHHANGVIGLPVILDVVLNL
ncbi:hypothetical protein DRE_03362 [Drechslerella stenobrocha 248]|uniref:Uncharacterized protein n=1 Tax=Drechslerella stenobrocha 248 TaxID=1043628 RepID=W7I4Z3_9PEZI|nr:hypothetical protein DRE_03362 [Drechslerella stenobrocha 248]